MIATLLRQLLRDVRRELGWIVVYGALMSCAATALVLMAANAALVSDKGSATELFALRDASAVSVVESSLAEPADEKDVPPRDPEVLFDLFDELLVSGGRAGSIVRVPGGLGFDQVLVFVGAFAELMSYGGADEPVVLAVSRDQAGTAPETLELAGRSYPLGVAPDDMGIPYPSYYEGPELVADNYPNALFVFCTDYRLACELVPEIRSVGPSDGPLGGLALFGATPDDEARLRSAVLDATGRCVRVTPVDELGAAEGFESPRTQRAVIAFYVVAAVAIGVVLVTSLYGALARRVGELAICHLFGAPLWALYVRMAAFALIYQAIPGAVTLWSLGSVGPVWREASAALPVVALAVVAESLLVALLAWRQLAGVALRGTREV